MLSSGHLFSWHNPNFQMVPFSLFMLACKPCLPRESIVWKLGLISHFSYFLDLKAPQTSWLTRQPTHPGNNQSNQRKQIPESAETPTEGLSTSGRLTGTGRELHLKVQPGQHSPAQTVPSEQRRVWVAPAPLSRGLRAQLAASFGGSAGTAWVAVAARVPGHYRLWWSTRCGPRHLCAPQPGSRPSSFAFPYPLKHKAMYTCLNP